MNKPDLFSDLGIGVRSALETYSNVHRGSGHFSLATTHLYERARDIVLDYLELKKGKYIVIFCSPGYADLLRKKLKTDSFKIVSSKEIGLPIGVRAIAVAKRRLPAGIPYRTGGGTANLISPDWVIWAGSPDKYEAGTPSIINIITFARALSIVKKYGIELFTEQTPETLSANEILYQDELAKFSGTELLKELRKTTLGRGVSVPTSEGTREYINLDNSASTPTFEPVWKSVMQTWSQPQQIQNDIIQEVSSICAAVFGAPLDSYDIIFTSNTTEAINLAAESIGRGSSTGAKSVVLTSLLEHSSNDLPWRFASTSIVRLSIDGEGFVKMDELEKLLSEYNQERKHGEKHINIVAVSGASNVLGSFNNLEEISRIVHKYGAHLLVDAAQLAAHRSVGIEKCGIDYLAFSAHKVYAPFGTGVLITRKGLLNFNSADLNNIKSSGEENTSGIAALGKSLVLLQRIGMDLIREEEQTLTRQTLTGMAKIKGLKIYGITDPGSPRFDRKGGVIAFTLNGFMSDKIARELSLRGGIGIRFGCHCAHILVKHILGVPPSLQRFQKLIARFFPRLRFPGVARVSFGIGNTEHDVDTLIEVLGKIGGKSWTLSQKETEKQINEYVRACEKRVYS
jgi:selenocysteine lyase/cysteine desulfurase